MRGLKWVITAFILWGTSFSSVFAKRCSEQISALKSSEVILFSAAELLKEIRKNIRATEDLQILILEASAEEQRAVLKLESSINRLIRTRLKLFKAYFKSVHLEVEFTQNDNDFPIIEVLGGASWLGRVTQKLREKMGLRIVYDPHDFFSGSGWSEASYDSEEKTIFLPHLSLLYPDEMNPVVLHEVRHASVDLNHRIHVLDMNADTSDFEVELPHHKKRTDFEKSYSSYQSIDEVLAFYTEAVSARSQYKLAKSEMNLRRIKAARLEFYESRRYSLGAAARNEILFNLALKTIDQAILNFDRSNTLNLKMKRWRRDRFYLGERQAYVKVSLPVAHEKNEFTLSFKLSPIAIKNNATGRIQNMLYTKEFLDLIRQRLTQALAQSQRIKNLGEELLLR